MMYLVHKLNLDIVDYHNFATAKITRQLSGSHRFGANQTYIMIQSHGPRPVYSQAACIHSVEVWQSEHLLVRE